jgi:hypothetical protein
MLTTGMNDRIRPVSLATSVATNPLKPLPKLAKPLETPLETKDSPAKASY